MSARRAAARAGVWTAGFAVGVLAERQLVRRPVRPALAGDAFPTLEGLRQARVACSDGVSLAVRESGPPDAALTVVFVHGYTVTAECWAAQVKELSAAGLRLVLYDQRGHGASSIGPPEHDTIEQLGKDLAELLEARVPTGKVVLVGHSMGGMTIMALAEQHPELFGDRIVAVALIGTSSGGMAHVSLGLPAAVGSLAGRMAPLAPRAAPLNRRADRLRAADSDLARWINARVALGPDAPPGANAAMIMMQAPMHLETMASFLPTFGTHERATALWPLKAIPTLILVGECDILTPPDHSRTIARALPDAELVIVPRAAHMVMMEAPEIVNSCLRHLIERAT